MNIKTTKNGESQLLIILTFMLLLILLAPMEIKDRVGESNKILSVIGLSVIACSLIGLIIWISMG
jgi:hypothetical protein